MGALTLAKTFLISVALFGLLLSSGPLWAQGTTKTPPPPLQTQKAQKAQKTQTPPAPVKAADKSVAKRRQATLPLAPTKKDLQRLRAAKDRAAEEKADEAKNSRGRVLTQLPNTAGPGAPQGAGTNQDRKAATLEAASPNPNGP